MFNVPTPPPGRFEGTVCYEHGAADAFDEEIESRAKPHSYHDSQ